MKVRNYIPFAKLANQLPRESRDLPWGEPVDGLHPGEDYLPWIEHEEGPHWGDVAVLAVCVVGFVAALFGLY